MRNCKVCKVELNDNEPIVLYGDGTMECMTCYDACSVACAPEIKRNCGPWCIEYKAPNCS